MLLAEHKLNSRHILNLTDYKVIRQNRSGGRGGGTAVLVRDNLDCDRVYLELGGIDNTVVRIWREDGTALLVVSIYLRPTLSLGVFDLVPLLDLSCRESILIGADHNAKHPDWGGTVSNSRGLLLRNFLLTCSNLSVWRTDGPVCIFGEIQSYIDIIVTTSVIGPRTDLTNALRTLDYESDHRAVEIVLSTGEIPQHGEVCFVRLR